MKFTSSLTLLMAYLVGNAAGTSLRASELDDVASFTLKMSLHEDWTKTHSKEYTTEEEKMQRLKIWIDNHGTSKFVIQRQHRPRLTTLMHH